MVKFRILQARSQTIISSLESDLNTVSQNLKSGGDLMFEHPTAAELTTAIKRIRALSEMLSKKELSRVRQLLKHFIFLLDKYEVQILSSSSTRLDKKALRDTMRGISEDIGVVPRLKSHPELPLPQFLPKKHVSTVKKWKRVACPNPSRSAKTIEGGKITFLSRDDSETSSVRAALKAAADTVSSAKVQLGPNTHYLNLSDCEYYQLGQLHADHFLPSAQLIE
ncbi:MAG: hypothetical protein NXI01_08980 [Gammaproteobacteria bacterium]|nr:hypothetical protein [Gammaproteobacteria bacterium]